MPRSSVPFTLAALALPAAAHAEPAVSTLAGSFGGFADGTGAAAIFNTPHGIDLAPDGSLVVADRYNKRIRRVLPDGRTTTVAGTDEGNAEDGPGATATFNNPTGVAQAPDGSLVVADYQNGRLRRIGSDGVVSTITEGSFYAGPRDVAVDARGVIYVAEAGANWVRAVYPDGRRRVVVKDIAEPWGVDVDGRGNVYVTDYGNQRIVKVTRAGRRHVLAGNRNYGLQDGPPGVATFGRPAGIAVGRDGFVYVADRGTHRIRRISPRGHVETIAGGHEGFDDGPASRSRFDEPVGLAIAPDGRTLFVGDSKNHKIRVITGIEPGRERDEQVEEVGATYAREQGIPVWCGANGRALCRWTVVALEGPLRGRVVGRARKRLFSGYRQQHWVRVSRRLRGPVRVQVTGTVSDGGGKRRIVRRELLLAR